MKNKWPKSGEKTGFGGTLGLALSLWPPHSKIGGDATAGYAILLALLIDPF